MATDIKMPQLSDTMSSGKILTWKLKEGDIVKRGDILAEVETDKANLEIESFFNGSLLKIMIPAGSVAQVGEVIAVIGQAGELASKPSPSASETSTSPVPSAPPEKPVTIPTNSSTPSSPAALTVVSSQDRVKASPLANLLRPSQTD